MKTIQGLGWGVLLLTVGTISACVATVAALDAFLPETGVCVSFRGISWGVSYLAFYVVNLARLSAGKALSIKAIFYVFIMCVLSPALLVRLMIAF